MPGVIPNYKEGPTSWPVCGYLGVGTPTTITGGMVVHPNALQPSMVEPQLALGLDSLGVASNDAAAPRTSQDSQNPAVISQQPDIVAVYYGMDIDVTYATDCGCGELLVAAAAGTVQEWSVAAGAAPAFPLTTVAVQNTGTEAQQAVISGTALFSNISIGATGAEVTVYSSAAPAAGAGNGNYLIGPGEWFVSTYASGTPTWVWTPGAATASLFTMIVGRCTQPGGVNIAANVVGSARIISVL
jgi:hypothetical protein